MSRGLYCINNTCFTNKFDNPDLSFFSFPKDYSLAKQWVEIMDRSDLLIDDQYLKSHYRICSKHFTWNQFKKTYPKMILRTGSIPQHIASGSIINVLKEHNYCIPIMSIKELIAPEFDDQYLKSHYRICSKHFTWNQFKKTYPKMILRTGSIPQHIASGSIINVLKEHNYCIPIMSIKELIAPEFGKNAEQDCILPYNLSENVEKVNTSVSELLFSDTEIPREGKKKLNKQCTPTSTIKHFKNDKKMPETGRPLGVRRQMWLQHDDAPTQFSIQDYLNEQFYDRCIGRDGPVTAQSYFAHRIHAPGAKIKKELLHDGHFQSGRRSNPLYKSLKEKYSDNSDEVLLVPDLLHSMDSVRVFNILINKEENWKEVSCHASVQKIVDKNPGIIICDNLFLLNLLPVIPLHHTDVTKWYDVQINKIKQKLGFITSDDCIKNICDHELPTTEFRSKLKFRIVKKIPPVNSTQTSAETITTRSNLNNEEQNLLSQKTNTKFKSRFVKSWGKIDVAFTQKSNNIVSVAKLIDKKRDIYEELLSKLESLNSNDETLTKSYSSIESPISDVLAHSKEVFNYRKDQWDHTYSNCEVNFVISRSTLPELSEPEDSEECSKPKKSKTPELDSMFIIKNSKSVEMFLCLTCDLLCKTKKLLIRHQKTHLCCVLCKIRFKSRKSLENHKIRHCLLSKVKDNAYVKLTRLENVPELLEIYSKSLQASASVNVFDNGGIKDEFNQ
ncbi:hypothetical protein FQR65_LT10317 [Abscondita terminalis]|nr:hypothetical protein FQR65_LT10317 [Abscondita terminalis]